MMVAAIIIISPRNKFSFCAVWCSIVNMVCGRFSEEGTWADTGCQCGSRSRKRASKNPRKTIPSPRKSLHQIFIHRLPGIVWSGDCIPSTSPVSNWGELMPFALVVQPWVSEFPVQVVTEGERLPTVWCHILHQRFHNASRHFIVTARAFIIIAKVPRINLDVGVKIAGIWRFLVRPVVVQLQFLAPNGQMKKFCRAQKGRFHILHGIVDDREPSDENTLLFQETEFFINLQFLYDRTPLATYTPHGQ